jgi:hypothetical protein
MSLLSAILQWFVGSAIMWGLWLGYTLDPKNHIDSLVWGFFTVIFALLDVIALMGMIRKQVD